VPTPTESLTAATRTSALVVLPRTYHYYAAHPPLLRRAASGLRCVRFQRVHVQRVHVQRVRHPTCRAPTTTGPLTAARRAHSAAAPACRSACRAHSAATPARRSACRVPTPTESLTAATHTYPAAYPAHCSTCREPTTTTPPTHLFYVGQLQAYGVLGTSASMSSASTFSACVTRIVAPPQRLDR
jgi:hypothetical protein